MTTFLRPVQDFFSYGVHPFTPLEQAIVKGTTFGNISYNSWGPVEITAPLQSVSKAVESAYVLTEKATLPKITLVTNNPDKRRFSFAGDPFTPYATDPNHTSEQARKTAAKWLSIAAYLEAEEKVKADEAKKKAEAEKAEANARTKRRDELANLYFGEYFDALGTKKASAIEEIYRLEQELKADRDAA